MIEVSITTINPLPHTLHKLILCALVVSGSHNMFGEQGSQSHNQWQKEFVSVYESHVSHCLMAKACTKVIFFMHITWNVFNYYITEYLIEVSVSDQLNNNFFYKSTKVIKITH